jgi:hypothetical protein
MGRGDGGYKAAGGGDGGGGCRGLGRRGRDEKPVNASTASVQSDAEPVSNTGPVSNTAAAAGFDQHSRSTQRAQPPPSDSSE